MVRVHHHILQVNHDRYAKNFTWILHINLEYINCMTTSIVLRVEQGCRSALHCTPGCQMLVILFQYFSHQPYLHSVYSKTFNACVSIQFTSICLLLLKYILAHGWGMKVFHMKTLPSTPSKKKLYEIMPTKWPQQAIWLVHFGLNQFSTTLISVFVCIFVYSSVGEMFLIQKLHSQVTSSVINH